MPTTREFKTQPKKTKKTKSDAFAESTSEQIETQTVTAAPKTSKRRPGRTEKENPTPMEAAMNTETEMQAEDTSSPKAEDVAQEFEAKSDEERIEINFAGSELLRSRFPKPFEVAEAVATDWMKDGKFDHLPISHPLANWAAQQGLTKAKEIEKKVVESPRFEKAAMTALTMAMKAQNAFEQLRTKVKR